MERVGFDIIVFRFEELRRSEDQIPDSDAFGIDNWMLKLQQDCFDKYYSRKASIEQTLRETERDIIKKHASLVKKSLKILGETDCVDMTKESHLRDLNEFAVSAAACLDEVADTIEGSFEVGQLSWGEAYRTRDLIKRKIDDCKNRGKRLMKNVEDSFESNGKRCLF